MALADNIPHLGTGTQGQPTVVLGNFPQRHLLDKGNIQLLLPGELDQFRHFHVVPALHHHRIQLDTPKARLPGGFNAIKHLAQFAGAGYTVKLVSIQ